MEEAGVRFSVGPLISDTMRCMETQETLQRVIDVAGLGKISRWEAIDDIYVLTTARGRLAVFVDDETLGGRRREEPVIEARIQQLLGAAQRVLMPSHEGGLEEYSSYVHQNHRYYSIYKLGAPSELSSD
jgi:hypothetical protein